MTDPYTPLSETQLAFLQSVSTQVGVKALNQRFDLIRRGTRKYAKLGKDEIPINLSDDELLDLARTGYIQIHSSVPQHIIFTSLEVTESAPGPKKEDHLPRKQDDTILFQILRIDIIQVCAWLIASLIAVAIALYLLTITIQQVLLQNITAGVASAITTLISSLFSVIFFRNYDKANERLKHLRTHSPNELEKGKDQ